MTPARKKPKKVPSRKAARTPRRTKRAPARPVKPRAPKSKARPGQARKPKVAAPPPPPPPLSAAQVVQASPARVWAALTNADEVLRWLADRCEFERRVGGRVLLAWARTLGAPPAYVPTGRWANTLEARVETWEPPQRFRLQPVNFWPGTVTLRLEDALGGSTRVHVEHDGWPAKDDWYRAHADFWPRALDLLRAYLERPEAEFEAYRARKLGLTTA